MNKLKTYIYVQKTIKIKGGYLNDGNKGFGKD